MNRPAGVLCLTALVAGCGTSSSRPCQRELDAVRERESQRIHGLTQNDDVREAINRIQSAAQCVPEDDAPALLAHVFLLRSRLEARGDTESLLALEQVLTAAVAGPQAPDRVRRGPDAARARLVAYAAAMRVAAGADADAQLRAHLTSLSLDPDHSDAFPHVTRALVNFNGPAEGCFTVVNHGELPAGTAVVSLRRAGAAVTLQGESTTFGVSKGKPRVVRLCAAGGLRSDDLVQVSVGGQPAWEQKLLLYPDDDIRGALRRNFKDADMTTLCAGAREHSARTACALFAARGAP